MSIYSGLQSVASSLFTEFKQGSVKHVQILSGLGSGDDPGESLEILTEINATVQSASSAVGKGAQSLVKNGLAVAGDLIVLTGIPVNPFSMKDFIEIDGKRYKITAILPKPAAGIPVAFALIVRR